VTSAPVFWPLIACAVVFVTMAGEAVLSSANERVLLARGATIVPDASFPWMRVTYPAGFVAVLLEGWRQDLHWHDGMALGLAIFLLGKVVKYAAIATLGTRWSFRVLVLPGEPLVDRGIYAVLRHPNYVGVAGEVIGAALWMQAPITGTLFAVTFGFILLWRIRIEERALGLAPRS
jgi:methyltransferase